jgi:hypothetical protein
MTIAGKKFEIKGESRLTSKDPGNGSSKRGKNLREVQSAVQI